MVLSANEMASLHCHSSFSLLDSTMSPEFIVQQAKELGYKAVALSEHGNMHSFINGYKEAKKQGIKYIFASEVYETDDMDYKESDASRYHLLLLAKNKTGLDNLFKVVSEGATRGFYGKPRIDRKLLKEHSEGLIATSACLASRLMRLLQQGYCPCCKQGNGEHKESCDNDEVFEPKWEEAKVELQKYKDIFGDDFYIEIQSHDTYDQKIGNQRILQLAKETDTKFILTFDAHMKDGDEKTLDIHRRFIEVSQSGREVGETYVGCYQQDMDTVYNTLIPQIGQEDLEQAILNTGALADSCEDIELDLSRPPIMPHIKVPSKFEKDIDYLKHIVNKGWIKREIHKKTKEEQKIYKERVLHEIDILEKLDYTGYFLIIYKFMNKFKEEGIPLGWGRGSAAGSLILYLIGVTEVDSVYWDLDFSRFANLGRRQMADVDIDISKEQRGKALKITDDMFGKNKVAHLCTFNSFSPKVAIKDLGKVFNNDKDSPYYEQIPYALREKASEAIPDGTEIQDALKSSNVLKDIKERFPLWIEYAQELQNLPKSVGSHASAIIIANEDITNYAPVMYNKDGRIMMQVEMKNAEKDLSLVKFDYLG